MERRRAALSIIATLLVAGLITGIAGGPAMADLPSCTNCIEAGDIASGAVRASELGNDLDDTVDRNDIATGGVGSAEILNGSVGGADLAFNPATQNELDQVEGLVYNATVFTSLRVAANGDELGNFGFIRDFTTSYDGDNDRYELVTASQDSLNLLGIAVTPMCSTADSWYVETPETSTDVWDTIYVYLLDDANAATTCEFGLIAA